MEVIGVFSVSVSYPVWVACFQMQRHSNVVLPEATYPGSTTYFRMHAWLLFLEALPWVINLRYFGKLPELSRA
jgi:hypothetical protein